MNETFFFRSVRANGRQTLQRIRAETFELAKEKALYRFSHIKHFKQTMDLVTALERAAKASLQTKKPYYISVEEDGECTVSTAPVGTVTHKFTNGLEDKTFKVKGAAPEVKEAPVTEEKSNKKMIKEKAAKKSKPAKKVTAKVVVKKDRKLTKRAMYGIGIEIVKLIKQRPQTMEQLVAKFKQQKSNVSFHLSLARRNGVVIENTDKGNKAK